MATEPEEAHYSIEEEGGPTKSFLEHLEDLRWMLLKCAAAIAVGFLVCLFAAPTVVKVLKWPLERAALTQPRKDPMLTLMVGTNRLGSFRLETNRLTQFGTNRHVILDMVPVDIGGNRVLALQPATNTATLVAAEEVSLLNFGPASAFLLSFQMAIYGGIVLGSPFLIYFIGQFVFPALKIKEKKYVGRGLSVGIGLFLSGVAFCYFLLMPTALMAAVKYSEWMGFKADQWRAEEYIGFVCKFLIGMGLGFEMPVIILVLVKIGVVTYRQLAAFRRYMIVINLVLGAVLTTPEIITQVMMAVPLQILYELSVWIAWYWEKKDRERSRTMAPD